eukprot:TRINITY_DN6996_c0_g1_i1.p1 TRINITY_DN6996_c0_g1~~TRINITY_DN6996_c0_g1_i1.p1  ORF type:complete len:271 (-),score=43.37 TRINITY_DN6996_c0_g1_i1:244-1056(-)
MAPPSSSDCSCLLGNGGQQETLFFAAAGSASSAIVAKSPPASLSYSLTPATPTEGTYFADGTPRTLLQEADTSPADCHSQDSPAEEELSRAEAQRLVVLLAAMLASPESSEAPVPSAEPAGLDCEWPAFVGGSMLFGNLPLRSPLVPGMWTEHHPEVEAQAWHKFSLPVTERAIPSNRRVRISDEAPAIRHVEVTVAEWRSKQAAWRQIARDVPTNQRQAAEERHRRWLGVDEDNTEEKTETEQAQLATQSPVIRASKCCDVVEIFPEEP